MQHSMSEEKFLSDTISFYLIKMSKKYGFLTELQFKVLQLRIVKGLSQADVAKILKTTRENVSVIEKRAKRNIQLAEETLQIYKSLFSVASVRINPGTHLIDIPGMLVRTSDKIGIKLRINFTRVYDEIRFKAKDCINGTMIIKPIIITIFKDGNIEIIPTYKKYSS